eukprot:1155512-Pelagomonas_calceolata.AAC.4
MPHISLQDCQALEQCGVRKIARLTYHAACISFLTAQCNLWCAVKSNRVCILHSSRLQEKMESAGGGRGTKGRSTARGSLLTDGLWMTD